MNRITDAESSDTDNIVQPSMEQNENVNVKPLSDERPDPTCGAGILRLWAWLQKVFLLLLEKLFEKSAMFISRYPFRVIFFCLFLVITLTLGFSKLEVEDSVKYLFLPEGSQALQDLQRARRLGFELEFRQEEIIFLPKHNRSLLSKECLSEIVDLHKLVTGIKFYHQQCLRSRHKSTCVSTNLLEIFDYQKKNLVHIPRHIQAALRNDSFLMSNGRRLQDNFNQIFGKATSNSSLHSIGALRSVYLMKEYPREDKNREKILDWEKSFLNEVSSFAENTTCASIFYSAERSLDDSVRESTTSDIRLFAMTFTIMGMFSAIVNSRCGDARFGHQLLGFTSLLAIYLGITAALGFLMFTGAPFISLAGVLPFLVVSIGIDDVFIILHELNEMVRQNIPAMYMLSGTMARSGPTITMTTLTDLVAFAVSCRSIFPGIRYFCTYAAVTICSAFLMLVTFFVGCMWFDIKRINAKRRDFLPCLISPPSTNRCFSIQKNGLDNTMRAWGKLITSLPGKLVVCFSSFLLLSGGIYGALNIDESFNRQLLTSKDSYYRKFLNVFESNFFLNIEVNVIFPGQVIHSSKEIQKMYADVGKIAESNEYFISRTNSWLSEFQSWAKIKNVDINDTRTFYQYLHHFISLPKYKRFYQDLKFSDNKEHLLASRLSIFSESSPDSIFQRDMMISIRNDLSRLKNDNVFAVSPPFIFFEQYAHVLTETIKNIIVAGISILVISSMFLNHFVIIICLLCGFIALILELFGLMYIWGVSVNSLSMINLVMALGFSVDYNAHVAYHFVSSNAPSSELRVIDALGKIGGSVFLGGLSTFLGMMPTGFASSTIFQIFFKMFVGIVFLGLFHGLVILPVYLALLGKVFDFRKMNIDPLIFKMLKRAKKQKSQATESEKKSFKCLVNAKTSSPAAIVGMSCRFPGGVNSKDDFWNLLVEGRSGMGSYPTNRPDSREFIDCFSSGKNTPGKHHVLSGCFLDNITGFDSQFFKISPTECRSMDPQQRILLQVVYEAIEDAGIRLEDLQQCRTGVYVGLMNAEFGSLLLQPSNIRSIDQFCSTGCALSIAANRISFSLNLTGPSLTLDTACSSSLVAFDVAFGHLQTGECDVAIVCAPNILLTGYQYHIACCRTGLLADDGRCKSFDIKGDGYGRGEGVAAIVIKPTKTACEDNDDIYAEVVACGTNNDGQTAIPMTAPSEVTQAALFQKVLQESGLSKDDIQYVEVHGTGTAIGDVIEMGSVASVYGNSSNRILRLGSVKSNVNHTESTAGLAGLIKTCLMIKHAQFVPTINVQEVKPQLKIPERKMMVQLCHEPWNIEEGTPRTAAVSSYGFGGTNAHVIVREVMKSPETAISRRSTSNRVMTLSAATKDALREMAQKVSLSFQTKSDNDELLKDNICYSMNERYTVHSHRLALSFSSLKHAARSLQIFANQETGWEELVAYGEVNDTRNKIVFLYGGQGAQWFGMAKEMLIHEPKFREGIEKIDSLLKRYGATWSLISELNKTEETSRLHVNPIGQTALFAIHFAITELLESWGVTPSAVVGHSLGEISAAWASGALRLHKALQLVLFRSQLHERCSPTGCMAAIGLSQEDAQTMLQALELENEVDVAVVNSPGNVVLSGSRDSIELVENHVISSRNDIFWRKLSTTRAYHSREMEEIEQSYFKLTSKFNVRQMQNNIPFYSTVTGTQLSGQHLSLEHWWKNIRQAVLLENVLKTIFSDGYQFFIEINATPQLSYHVRRTWSDNQKPNSLNSNNAVVIHTLAKRSASQQHLSFLQNCVSHLFTNGVPLTWSKLQGSGSKLFCPRPTYPWQETEFWYRNELPPEFVTLLDERKPEENKGTVTFHPLLGKAVPTETFTGLQAWESEIDLYNVSYIRDHKFLEFSEPVFPAALYVEMVLAMSLHLSPGTFPDIKNISFDHLLTIAESDSHKIRTRLLPGKYPGDEKQFQITIVNENEIETVLSEGFLQQGVNYDHESEEIHRQGNLDDIEVGKSTMAYWPKDNLEKERQRKGLEFGPYFDLIKEAWSTGSESLVLICPTEDIKEATAYVIHPSIIDACFQTMLVVRRIEGKFVPRKVTRITIVQKPISTDYFYAHTKILESEKIPTYNIRLMDPYGRPVMIIEKYATAEISSDRSEVTYENSSFTPNWELVIPEKPEVATQENIWLILSDQSKFAERFIQYIPAGDRVMLFDNTSDKFPEIIKEADDKLKAKKRLLVINFWPVDCSKYDVDMDNVDPTFDLAFKSCLVISKEILKRETLSKNTHLVIVTAGVVTIQKPNPPVVNSDTFPWSASVFGFRRTFAEEIKALSASVVDLPSYPSDDDFQAMVEDVQKPAMEEEVAYRNRMRYSNRIKELDPGKTTYTKPASTVTNSGEQQPFKLATMSGRWFLQKVLIDGNKRSKIEVFHACPVLQKPWKDLETNDRIAFAGKFFDEQEENEVPLVVGVCEVNDLGSYVATDKCCFTAISSNFTVQQAASLSFPLAISHYIFLNLLGDMKGKKVLIYHQSEEVCSILACVATSLDIKVVCVIKNQNNKDRMKKFEKLVVISENELKVAELNPIKSMDLDAVCLFSKISTYVSHQIIKHLKPGAKVIVSTRENNVQFNPFCEEKNVHCIMTNLETILTYSDDFSKLLISCCSILQSKNLLEKVLEIPQLACSIYDVMDDDSNFRANNRKKSEENGFYTVSFKPKNIPEKFAFYNLPLDGNGLKGDRTYLVIGGVRGFGFEFAKWLVENGAKTVMCTSRSAPSADKHACVQQLENKNGSRVLLRQADATSREDMNVIQKELESLPAVAGIAFTAMILEDQLLTEADLVTCKKVMDTKIKGSVILHQLSLSMDLDFFIMFSSISGVLGNIGQVSYASANSFLDQLCEYRQHKLGLPALSVNWGPISGAGVLERKSNIAENLEKHGHHALHYATAMEFLKRVLLENSNQSQVCLAALDWQVYLQSHTSLRLQQFRNKMLIINEKENIMTLEDLALQPLEFRMNYVEEYIKRLLSSWSGSDIAEIDLNVGMVKYGIDSIAATNMKLQIQNNIGAVFETYYFIQPKTTGLIIISDILEQIEKICTDCSEDDSNDKKKKSMPLDTIQVPENNITPTAYLSENRNDVNQSDVLELQTVEKDMPREKVIPLYDPDDAVVRVFLIHSSQKSALALAPFALGFQQQTHISLFGIGVDDTSFQKSDYGTVWTLAQRYVGFIRKIQSHGPYYLAGYSFGGTVAYEMASYLKRNNETVAMVFMVDTYAWFPKALTNCSEYIQKCTLKNMESAEKFVTRQVIEKVALVALGITQNEVHNLHAELEDDDKVIATLQGLAAEKNVDFSLKDNVDTVQYEIQSAGRAHNEWQPSKVCYDETITYIACDETNSFRLWSPDIWKSVAKRVDFFYVSGSHFELGDETRGKICGSIMMITASMKYRSTFSTFKLQVVRSRSEERLVQSLKQGLEIWMLPNPGSSKLLKGTLLLDNEETSFRFESESFGRRKMRKTFLKELTNILPGRHVDVIRKHQINKSRINSLICMITKRGTMMTFYPNDWQQFQQLIDALRALFGIPFIQ